MKPLKLLWLAPLMFVVASVHGESVHLAWDRSASTNVVGYNVYLGPDSGSYTNRVTVGNTNYAVVNGLVTGATYFFACTAFDDVGLESEPSNEIQYTVPFVPPVIPPNAPTNLTVVNPVFLVLKVIPPDSGVVSAEPDKQGGAYVWNETVSVTATAEDGYRFLSWTGDASGTNNPLTLSLTGHKTITAAFTNECVPVPFATNFALAGLFNNASRWQGMRFRVGDKPVSVTALGRYFVAGNSQQHELRLYDTNKVLLTGALWIPQGSESNRVVYVNCPPFTLQPGQVCDLVSRESIGGDRWHHHSTVVFPSAAGVVQSAVYGTSPTSLMPYNPGAHCYGPLNFLFCQ